MKKLLILGGGTAETMMVNKLHKALDQEEWDITIVDQFKTHYYQPGFLFIPFSIYNKQDVIKPKNNFFPPGINVIYKEIDKIIGDENKVLLEGGQVLHYDYLIIATGTQTRPDETPGLKDKLWYKSIFDFYTIEGVVALQNYFKNFKGGKLVMCIAEIPFKCPVASKMLGDLLEDKNIKVVPDFYLEHIDNDKKTIIGYDEREIEFDVLTIVPVNMGSEMIERSGLGDDLNFVPTDKHTLRSEKYENVFILGDASNIPTSKAGSVAHFASEILFDNLISIFESANDFVKDAAPIANEVIIDFQKKLGEIESKGYFEFFGEATKIIDNIVTHFSKEDVRLLADNIVIILETVKGITQPEMLRSVDNAIKVYAKKWLQERH